MAVDLNHSLKPNGTSVDKTADLRRAKQTPTQKGAEPRKDDIFTRLNDLKPGTYTFNETLNKFVDAWAKTSMSRELEHLSRKLRSHGVADDQIQNAQEQMKARLLKHWSQEVFNHAGKLIENPIESPKAYRVPSRNIGEEYQKHHPNDPLPAPVIDGVNEAISMPSDRTADTADIYKLDDKPFQRVKTEADTDTKQSPKKAEPLVYSTGKSGCSGNDVFIKPTRRQSLKREVEIRSMTRSRHSEAPTEKSFLSKSEDNTATPDTTASLSSRIQFAKVEAQDDFTTTPNMPGQRGAGPQSELFTAAPFDTPIVDQLWGRNRAVELANQDTVIPTIIRNIREHGTSNDSQSETTVGSGSTLSFSVRPNEDDGLKERLHTTLEGAVKGIGAIRSDLENTSSLFVRANEENCDMSPIVIVNSLERQGIYPQTPRKKRKRPKSFHEDRIHDIYRPFYGNTREA